MTLATATAKVEAFFSPRDAIVKERSDLKTKLAAAAAARQAFASLAIPALPSSAARTVRMFTGSRPEEGAHDELNV